MFGPFGVERAPAPGRGRRGERCVRVSMAEAERTVLIGLLVQVQELLQDDAAEATQLDPPDAHDPLAQLGLSLRSPPREPPTDPALARLLPEANRDDVALAAEFRRLTEADLRTRKQESARVAAEALRRPDPTLLPNAEALCLLKSLTDLRLVLGERLELRTDEDAELLHAQLRGMDAGRSEEWLGTAAMYEVLTVWQESLVAAISKVGPRR